MVLGEKHGTNYLPYTSAQNTLKNILSILQRKIAYDIMPVGKRY